MLVTANTIHEKQEFLMLLAESVIGSVFVMKNDLLSVHPFVAM